MRPRRSYTLLAIAVLPALALLQNSKISEPVHTASLTVLKPVMLLAHSGVQAASDVRDSFGRFWRTFNAQKQYETKMADLESKLVQYDEALRENDRLKKLLGFKQTLARKSTAAHVIAWDISPWRKTIILDKGTKEGVKKDMAVMVPEGLVGRVLEAGPSTARAILLIDPDARVNAAADESRAQGVVGGDGSAQLRMTYLGLDAGAAVGETVLTSGVGGLFPKGLKIGKITALVKDSSGLHLSATVEPFAPFTKLEEVLCLEYFQDV